MCREFQWYQSLFGSERAAGDASNWLEQQGSMSRNSKLMKCAAIALMQIALASATAIEASAADPNKRQ
jgi:hypothetical protein